MGEYIIHRWSGIKASAAKIKLAAQSSVILPLKRVVVKTEKQYIVKALETVLESSGKYAVRVVL